ncbi:hypothetical protein FHU36_003735 [Nonomuraea muscovyensis]|uniref:Uncharacterized protein n=1 Tax=Nonomuraea muscovyensis TaxID=1124761 RepID=A0A7X0C4B0_9ACTN|nr:hypothetical protein [Nonomuraea muscovyensis]
MELFQVVVAGLGGGLCQGVHGACGTVVTIATFTGSVIGFRPPRVLPVRRHSPTQREAKR